MVAYSSKHLRGHTVEVKGGKLKARTMRGYYS